MNIAVRLVLLVGILGGLGFGYVFLFGEDKAAEPSVPKRWTSSQDCRSCHVDVWKEWYGSHHQISYLNPEVRRMSDDFRNKECQACHLPKPVSETGFAKRTLPRTTRPDEGIGCLTCHLAADGGIMGSADRPDLPCKPMKNDDYKSVRLCESCHNQHWTTDQWRKSESFTAGTSCRDCHMPEVSRERSSGVAGKGKSHVFPGAHDTEMLRRAEEFTIARDVDELVLTLANKGAGHAFPTEERHRAADIEYRFLSGDESEGEGEWLRAYRFRMPYRDEEGEDTQLQAGDTKEVRVAIPEGAKKVEARLWYRLAPYIDNEDPRSTMLEHRELDL